MWKTFYKQYQTRLFTLRLAGFLAPDAPLTGLTAYDSLLHWTPRLWWDGADLDGFLAEELSSLSPAGVIALGASLCPGFAPVPAAWQTAACGGVLGSPSLPPAPAAGLAEELEGGLSLFSLPGGPGCIASCSPCQLEEMALPLGRLPDKRSRLDFLRQSLAGLEAFLILDDGLGPDSTGCLELFNKETWKQHHQEEFSYVFTTYVSDPAEL